MVKCECKRCGKAFFVTSESKKHPYCSYDCSNQAKGEERKKEPKSTTLECKAEIQGRFMDIKFSRRPSRNTIDGLKDLGFHYDWRYNSWRSTKNKEKGKAFAELTVQMAKQYEKANRKTLCWTCQHSDKGLVSICPWAREFKPVDGWDAEPTVKRMWAWTKDGVQTVCDQESFCVFSCPIYKADER